MFIIRACNRAAALPAFRRSLCDYSQKPCALNPLLMNSMRSSNTQSGIFFAFLWEISHSGWSSCHSAISASVAFWSSFIKGVNFIFMNLSFRLSEFVTVCLTALPELSLRHSAIIWINSLILALSTLSKHSSKSALSSIVRTSSAFLSRIFLFILLFLMRPFSSISIVRPFTLHIVAFILFSLSAVLDRSSSCVYIIPHLDSKVNTFLKFSLWIFCEQNLGKKIPHVFSNCPDNGLYFGMGRLKNGADNENKQKLISPLLEWGLTQRLRRRPLTHS